jgi:hypothetical protein
MVATAFRDYSSILTPLPRIGSAPDTPRDSAQRPTASFQAALDTAQNRIAASPDRSSHAQAADRIPAADSQSLRNNSSISPISPEDSERLMKACRDIEGFFIGMLLRDFGKRIGQGGVFGQSFQSSFYQDLFFTEIARSMSDSGSSMGIADAIYKDIILKAPTGT